MERRINEAPVYDYDDNEVYLRHERSKKERTERALLIATILIAAFIIICMSCLVVLLVVLDPYEVAETLESAGYVDVASVLREAADIMAKYNQ